MPKPVPSNINAILFTLASHCYDIDELHRQINEQPPNSYLISDYQNQIHQHEASIQTFLSQYYPALSAYNLIDTPFLIATYVIVIHPHQSVDDYYPYTFKRGNNGTVLEPPAIQ